MTAPCRYYPQDCDRAACDRAVSCPGPVDMDAPNDRGDQRRRVQQQPERETKPTAPATAGAEEERRKLLRCRSTYGMMRHGQPAKTET